MDGESDVYPRHRVAVLIPHQHGRCNGNRGSNFCRLVVADADAEAGWDLGSRPGAIAAAAGDQVGQGADKYDPAREAHHESAFRIGVAPAGYSAGTRGRALEARTVPVTGFARTVKSRYGACH